DRLAVCEVEVDRSDRGSPAHADTVAGYRLVVMGRIGRVADVVEDGSGDRLADRVLVLEAGDAEVAPADRRAGLRHAEGLEAVAAHRMRAAGPEQVLGRDVAARSGGNPAELAEHDQRAAGEETAPRHRDEAH